MKMERSGIYRNKKNGKEYLLILTAIDVTNNKDSECVVYTENENVGKIYVRDSIEFQEKFEVSERLKEDL